MALRNVLKEGDESLLKKSRPITQFNDRLFELLDDMKETMMASNGVGLAAPQVGVLRRVVVVLDVDTDEIIELINPEILSVEGEQDGPEGCLSLPNVWGLVKRPDHVIVKAQDRNGDEFTVEGYDLLARAFCHECDHLDGVLFREHVYQFLTQEELDEYYAQQEEEYDEELEEEFDEELPENGDEQ